MPPDPTPEQVARERVMTGVHIFAAEIITLCGADTQMGLAARRLAQRARYRLIDNVDPDRAEVQDRVRRALDAEREKRQRIKTLLEK